MSDFSRIGRRFGQLRAKSRLTQNQLANYLGVDQSLISRYEKGERPLSSVQLESLANLFGCSVKTLVSEETPMEPLCFAFRASEVKDEDLENIAVVNKIINNLREMERLLTGEKK